MKAIMKTRLVKQMSMMIFKTKTTINLKMKVKEKISMKMLRGKSIFKEIKQIFRDYEYKPELDRYEEDGIDD